MRTEETIKESERLIENLKDNALDIAEKTVCTRMDLKMNEQIRSEKGIGIGDFFRDRSGHVGVFCGCHGQTMWGRFLDTKLYGCVNPAKKLTHEEALTAVFNSMPNAGGEA